MFYKSKLQICQEVTHLPCAVCRDRFIYCCTGYSGSDTAIPATRYIRKMESNGESGSKSEGDAYP